MEIIVTNHAIDEYKRHLKEKGSKQLVLENLSRFFSKKPMLVNADSYTLPRGGKSSAFKGRTMYLARMSWKYSRCLLLLIKYNEKYMAVTSLSGFEFKNSIKRKIILDVSENEIHEKITFTN